MLGLIPETKSQAQLGGGKILLNSFDHEINSSRAFNRRLAKRPALGGGGKISILNSFGDEIVIVVGPSTGDWLNARHLEEEERYLY